MAKASPKAAKKPSAGKAPTKKKTPVGKKKPVAKFVPRSKSHLDPKSISIGDTILDVVFEYDALGVPPPTQDQVAEMAGFASRETKTYRSAFKELKDRGFIVTNKQAVELNKDCSKLPASTANKATSNEEVQQRLSFLVQDSMIDKFIDILKDGVPRSRDYVLDHVGLKSPETKSFRNAVKKMKDLGMLETSQEKGKLMFELGDSMFPFGRGAAGDDGDEADDKSSSSAPDVVDESDKCEYGKYTDEF